MIYHLGLWLTPYWPLFNVVHYVSFRALAALISTVGLAFLSGGSFIRFAEKHFRSKARELTPARHRAKDNLPTMGGLFILFLVTVNCLLWCDLSKPQIWLLLASLLSFGAIGVYDDWAKIKQSRGISPFIKASLQCIAAGLIAIIWLWACNVSPTITFPFFKYLQPSIGLWFIPWAMLVIIGTSNAVNLTDGLDGLAIGSLMPNFATFSILCYLAGNSTLSEYLHIPFAQTADLAIAGVILFGASIGFLWYNAHPAQLFMGDVGSLSLGAGLAFMALACKQELLLLISGGVFVAETLSVIIQLASYRFRGKRVFRMAPMHHHFELLGWQEPKITVRFAIISLLLCLLALITIKVR